MATASDISKRILDSALAGQLTPGARLGEQQLATVFGCSRTIIREALFLLSACGIVTVRPRSGWYVIEPSHEDASKAFEARQVIETGLIRAMTRLDAAALLRLREHLRRQTAAVHGPDKGLRSFLLGDFHVCLADCLGNHLLSETIRSLTIRTTLAAAKHQSDIGAAESCADHVRIVDALEAGELSKAEQLMAEHLHNWHRILRIPRSTDPVASLRRALQPVLIPP